VIATLAVLSIAALPVAAYVQRGGYGGGGGWVEVDGVVTLAGVVAEQVTSVGIETHALLRSPVDATLNTEKQRWDDGWVRGMLHQIRPCIPMYNRTASGTAVDGFEVRLDRVAWRRPVKPLQ
jgi:hypothetical protein